MSEFSSIIQNLSLRKMSLMEAFSYRLFGLMGNAKEIFSIISANRCFNTPQNKKDDSMRGNSNTLKSFNMLQVGTII